MANYLSFSGVITDISDQYSSPGEPSGCYKLMTLEDGDQIVRFVVSPFTYFVDHETVRVSDRVTGFYDADRPAILIYPPQFEAVVIARVRRNRNVTVSEFDRGLISSDGRLRLNISPRTQIRLQNNQVYDGRLSNRDLVVVYGATTRSIPAQTTPSQVIVLCNEYL